MNRRDFNQVLAAFSFTPVFKILPQDQKLTPLSVQAICEESFHPCRKDEEFDQQGSDGYGYGCLYLQLLEKGITTEQQLRDIIAKNCVNV